jgi:hypothetical protein
MAATPVARTFEEICNRSDLFLRRLHAHGDTQRGLIIFDESRYEASVQTLLEEYRILGTRYGGTVKNFADVPFFANSKATRLLQLADLVAYAVFRRYERGDTRLLDKIITKFETEDGVIQRNRAYYPFVGYLYVSGLPHAAALTKFSGMLFAWPSACPCLSLGR